jgi:hypothetical protein
MRLNAGVQKHRDDILEELLVGPARHRSNEHGDRMTSLSVNRPQARVHGLVDAAL